jgi:putative phosphoribosyl transferase
MNEGVFLDRADAGRRLAARLAAEGTAGRSGAAGPRPLVLAIPRGGIEVAIPIARALGAELDVVLARKLRAPHQPELAIGAVSEEGTITLNRGMEAVPGVNDRYVREEGRRQLAEITRRRRRYREVRPLVPIDGRTVILTDDGIATGATMIAAVRSARAAGAREIVVAVPVGSPDRLAVIRPLCDRLVCLEAPENFMAVGQFYREFSQVEDARVVELLEEATGFGRGERVPEPATP